MEASNENLSVMSDPKLTVREDAKLDSKKFLAVVKLKRLLRLEEEEILRDEKLKIRHSEKKLDELDRLYLQLKRNPTKCTVGTFVAEFLSIDDFHVLLDQKLDFSEIGNLDLLFKVIINTYLTEIWKNEFHLILLEIVPTNTNAKLLEFVERCLITFTMSENLRFLHWLLNDQTELRNRFGQNLFDGIANLLKEPSFELYHQIVTSFLMVLKDFIVPKAMMFKDFDLQILTKRRSRKVHVFQSEQEQTDTQVCSTLTVTLDGPDKMHTIRLQLNPSETYVLGYLAVCSPKDPSVMDALVTLEQYAGWIEAVGFTTDKRIRQALQKTIKKINDKVKCQVDRIGIEQAPSDLIISTESKAKDPTRLGKAVFRLNVAGTISTKNIDMVLNKKSKTFNKKW